MVWLCFTRRPFIISYDVPQSLHRPDEPAAMDSVPENEMQRPVHLQKSLDGTRILLNLGEKPRQIKEL